MEPRRDDLGVAAARPQHAESWSSSRSPITPMRRGNMAGDQGAGRALRRHAARGARRDPRARGRQARPPHRPLPRRTAAAARTWATPGHRKSALRRARVASFLRTRGARPRIAGEVVGTLLEPGHAAARHSDALPRDRQRLLRRRTDRPADDTASCAPSAVARTWQVDESEAVRQVQGLRRRTSRLRRRGGQPRQAHQARLRLPRAARARCRRHRQGAVDGELQSPDEVAAQASHDAMKIATSTLLAQELVGFWTWGAGSSRSSAG